MQHHHHHTTVITPTMLPWVALAFILQRPFLPPQQPGATAKGKRKMRVHIQHKRGAHNIRSHSHKNAIQHSRRRRETEPSPRGAHKHKFHAYITLLLTWLWGARYTLLELFIRYERTRCYSEPIVVGSVHKHVTLFCLFPVLFVPFAPFREKHVILCFRFPLDLRVDSRHHVVESAPEQGCDHVDFFFFGKSCSNWFRDVCRTRTEKSIRVRAIQTHDCRFVFL